MSLNDISDRHAIVRDSQGRETITTGWTDVEISAPSLPEDLPDIDSDTVSSSKGLSSTK